VLEDRLLETMQLGTGLETELLDEGAPCVGVRLECFGLAAGSVEGEHELGAETLAQRVSPDEGAELSDQLRVSAEREVGVDPCLQRRQPLVLELGERIARERLVLEIRQRPAAPEVERPTERSRRFLGLAVPELAPAFLDQQAEALEVDPIRLDVEHVAGRARDEDAVRLEELPDPRHVLLERRLRVRGRTVTPELVDQAIAGHDLAGVQEQDGEHCPLTRPSELQRPPVVQDLERAEEAEFEAVSQGATVPRRAVSELSALRQRPKRPRTDPPGVIRREEVACERHWH
jgi:hypothetical protein